MDKADSASEGISLVLLNQYSAPLLLARSLTDTWAAHGGRNFLNSPVTAGWSSPCRLQAGATRKAAMVRIPGPATDIRGSGHA